MISLQPIIAGIDFSEGSGAALVRAADLAERLHVRLHVVYAQHNVEVHTDSVTAQEGGVGHSLKERVRDFAARALGGLKALEEIGPEVVVRHGEAPADALVGYAEEIGAGLVVVGTHGRRGMRHFLMGSVAEEVVRRAPCPVLTVPDAAARTAPSPEAPVLVPVDFSEANGEALAAAGLIAAQFEAPLALVHVVEEPVPRPDFYVDVQGLVPMVTPVLKTAARPAGAVARELRRFGETANVDAADTHVRIGRADREIVALAEEIGAGLIAMATQGLSGWEHAVLGSVTERVLRRAPCPVLSLRAVSGGDS